MTREDIIRRASEMGDLDEADIIELGTMHRELPLKDRDWTWLAELIGYDGRPESLRTMIKNHLRAEGLLPSAVRCGENEDGTPMTAHDFYKERQRLRDERNSISAKLRSEARFDDLKELVGSAIAKLKPMKEFGPHFATKGGTAEGILLFSDWHVGQDYRNFYGEYDLEIAQERVNTIVDKAIDYCHSFGIDTLHVLNLGDLIEGTINNTGRIESNEDAISQLMKATEMMANALNKLRSYIPNITYRSVTDNHSNITQNKRERIPDENLNAITTWYLKARLDGKGVDFMDDNLDIGLGRFELGNGMKVAFFHGHEDPKDKTLQNLVGATHEWTDIVCAGHYHNPAEHVYQNMRLFVNGSLCGTGPYALSHRMYTKPSQKLIIVDDGNFVNIDLSVDSTK